MGSTFPLEAACSASMHGRPFEVSFYPSQGVPSHSLLLSALACTEKAECDRGLQGQKYPQQEQETGCGGWCL